MQSIIDFFLKNISIIISIFSLLVSFTSLRISRKKFRFDELQYKQNYFLGIQKTDELLNIAKQLRNNDPAHLDKNKIIDDYETMNSFFEYYNSNEDKIIKVSYSLPQIIGRIKNIFDIIKDSVDKSFLTEEDMIQIYHHYSILYGEFEHISILTSSSSYSSTASKKRENFEYFSAIYWSFFNSESQLSQKVMNDLLIELKKAKEDYELSVSRLKS